MQISVKYIAPGFFNQPNYFELLEGSNILDLVQKLIIAWKRTELFLDFDGRMFNIFVVNGKRVDEDCVLIDGDEVVIIPPIGGG